MPFAKRTCEICAKTFAPSSGKKHWAASVHSRCPECRRAASAIDTGTTYAEHRKGGPLPLPEIHAAAKGDALNPPLIQAVFDIETWGLDRGWGVMLCVSILMHEGGPEPTWYEFDATQAPTWPEKRSDDSWLAAQVLSVLDRAHVLYAHNGENFDVRWLRTLALKYNLPFNEKKLVDPARIAWAKYRVGNNSLAALADFLELGEKKMPVPPDVWREAILDNSTAAWETLRQRCRSDVRVLNAIAARVTRDVGLLDFRGSAWGR